MTIIRIIIAIIAAIWLIKVIWDPKIDETRVGDILLYYGQPGNRKYIKLN